MKEMLFEYPPKIVNIALIPSRMHQGVLPNPTKKGSLFRGALPVVAVALYVCFGLAIKFPGADGHLAHARAPDSRTDASRFYVRFAYFLLLFWEETEKKENRKARRSFSFLPPRLWLKRPASALGGAGDALCSWGPRRA